MVKRGVVWIGLAVWMLGLGAGAALGQEPQRQMPEEFINAFKPMKGHSRASADFRKLFERSRRSRSPQPQPPPPDEGEAPEVPNEQWKAFVWFIGQTVPHLTSFRKASEARRARMARIARVTKNLPTNIVFEPPYTAALANPDGSIEDLFIGDVLAMADETGVVQAGAVIPYAIENPVFGQAYSRVIVEFDAWRSGRLQVLVIVPELTYSAARSLGAAEGTFNTIARLELQAYAHAQTAGDDGEKWASHTIVENPPESAPVLNAQISTNLVMSGTDNPLQVNMGDHVTIMTGLTATAQAYMGSSASAVGFGRVEKISVSIIQD